MARLTAGCLIFFLVMISTVNPVYSKGDNPDIDEEDTFQKVNFMVDFTDYEDGSVEQWLEEKGFQFERDARNRKKLDLDVSENGLVFVINQSMLGVILNEGVDLEEFGAGFNLAQGTCPNPNSSFAPIFDLPSSLNAGNGHVTGPRTSHSAT